MSDKNTRGMSYANNRSAAELHDYAEHVHDAAIVTHGMEPHLRSREMTRHDQEHEPMREKATDPNRPNGTPPSHQEIAVLAHQLWEERGSPDGSADEDWFRAERRLNNAAR